MIQQSVTLLCLLVLATSQRSITSHRLLLLQRLLQNRIDEFVADLHTFLDPILPKFCHPPQRTEVTTRHSDDLGFMKSMSKSIRWVMKDGRILGEGRRRWIGQPCGKRTHILSKQKFSRRVHSKSGHQVLEVDGIPLPQPHFKLTNSVFRVPVKNVEVTNTILAEERTSHGAVKSRIQSAVRIISAFKL